MPTYIDQLNRAIIFDTVPKRIISIVPSQTELLFHLGLTDEVVGITKFCTHPADKFKTTTKIGGTKQLNMELIKQLNPGLIIANKEENEREQVEELMRHYPVWVSDIANLEDALVMMDRVGALVGKETNARSLSHEISHRFKQSNLPITNLKVAYLIWRKPYMVAGSGTFITDMLSKCGLQNVFAQQRYPEVTGEMIVASNPDLVFLSSEPYPFKQTHIDEFKKLLPKAKVLLVDGEMFSWYGSRLLHAPKYFRQLLNGITLK